MVVHFGVFMALFRGIPFGVFVFSIKQMLFIKDLVLKCRKNFCENSYDICETAGTQILFCQKYVKKMFRRLQKEPFRHFISTAKIFLIVPGTTAYQRVFKRQPFKINGACRSRQSIYLRRGVSLFVFCLGLFLCFCGAGFAFFNFYIFGQHQM